MNFLTLEDIKLQCHLDDWQMEEQHPLLERYGAAAEGSVLRCCNRTLEDLYENYGKVPDEFHVAALMIAKDMYDHRGTNTAMAVNPLATFDLLLRPFVKLTTSDNANTNNNGRYCNL